MNTQTQKALKLAIEQMQHLIKIYIPSPEWSGTAIQEDCYETIQACKEALAQPALVCAGCGSTMTDAELAKKRKSNIHLVSCCPDRKMVEQPEQEPVAKIRVDFIKNQLNNLPKNTKLVEVLEDGTLKQL